MKYIEKYEFSELANRYATNIENGRFLWRNRVGAEHVEVQIKLLNCCNEQVCWTFDSNSISTKNI